MSGEIQYRSSQIASVSFPERSIDLIVMPYETEVTVVHQRRIVQEIVSRGAFDGIERRANRIRVNRDHDVKRTIGRAVALHPSRDEGLVAELRIARTDLGEETLTLAEDGILDASAGFGIMPGGEVWERSRGLHRLTKLWLAHIAMTPEPVYETANVLAVRAQPERPSCSNRERLELDRWQQLEADLNSRYLSVQH